MKQKNVSNNESRQLSVTGLYELRKSNLTRYEKIVKELFQGKDSIVTRERLLKGKIPNHEMVFQVHKEIMEELDDESKKIERDIEAEYEFLNKKEQEYQACLEEFETAKKNLEKASETLKSAKETLKSFEGKAELYQKRLSEGEARKKKMQIRILIHPSATMQQIVSSQYGIFVATNEDCEVLTKLGFVDRIFAGLEENYIVRIPYEVKQKVSDEKELLSMVSYANMVMYYHLKEEEDFVPIFSSEEIAQLLRANGYEY